jgi:hypothetical protein
MVILANSILETKVIGFIVWFWARLEDQNDGSHVGKTALGYDLIISGFVRVS